MRPDLEMVSDLPADAFGVSEAVGGDLDAEVRSLRQQIVTWSDRDHGRADEAIQLLAPHRQTPEGVVVSVLLVCTHRRFERCSRTLMRRLAAEGLLADDQLDELAARLLFDDRARFAVPSAWVSSRLDVGPGVRVRAVGIEVAPVDDEEQTFPYVQDIPAAARRWAARRLLEAGRTDVEVVLARARELDGGLTDGAAGAVRCGVLDAWERCSPADLEVALRAALGSGRASVRLRALDVLAAAGRGDEALGLARRDGAAQVRGWQPPADARARTPYQPTLLD